MTVELVARDLQISSESLLQKLFAPVLNPDMAVDALFVDSGMSRVMGIGNLPFKAPVMLAILNVPMLASYINKTLSDKDSLLILMEKNPHLEFLVYVVENEVVEQNIIPSDIAESLSNMLFTVESWGGYLNDRGEHIIDLYSPSPGPHFFVNLLIGNRIGFPYALQTTPKSVVDRLGRGSFRSHAATQVLATRWDLRQEENGFPANRQFYLVENGRRIFYSASPNDVNVESAVCIHSQNRTVIRYKTVCGLMIERVIFLVPQEPGLPLAVEAQQISIKNSGAQTRSLKLVYTGMFGPARPHALHEDVLYSNIIMQSKLLKSSDGSVRALGVHHYQAEADEDMRFHVMLVRKEDQITFPREFCCNYNEFVGNGTLENPAGLLQLSNNLSRKGPGFFALAAEIGLLPGQEGNFDNFTGLVSRKINPNFHKDTCKEEIENLIAKFIEPGAVAQALAKSRNFYNRYRGFLQIKTFDKAFDEYFNRNLPFQVLYQTFVSRSFCQTQKGYREIGFREIQDLYASMYYFVSMGMDGLVKELLREWCGMVFEFGYAYHNFFWEGKEPGKWSDDALWFIQALYRYINLTGDLGFLDEECLVAGTSPAKTRSIYNTVKAILRYSGEISLGKHGLPLLDNADWNDCLKLDNNYSDGVTKEKLYRQQLTKGGTFGEPFISDYSESVMNAFLLKIALTETIRLAGEKNDHEYAGKLQQLSQRLAENLQKHAWKEDFFARVLLNRFQNNEFTFLGAKGDKLSSDPNLDGSYFLNSFNWAILSDSATEEQIKIMLEVVESVLKTPFGIKLMSPADLGKISPNTATGEYFPGDRENGGVFKHACMMATAAMFKAAKQVTDKSLAERLTNLAYWMIDLVLPYKTMAAPFVTCGNPRFCTQYNNSETGENIGPMLSGTSTWLTLTLLSAFGIEYTRQGIEINPVLKPESTTLAYRLNTGKTVYRVNIQKPVGFYRIADGQVAIRMDGRELGGNTFPLLTDGMEHLVSVVFS